MVSKYKIVIAEDHTILREGLRALLSLDPQYEIIGEAEDGRDAIRCVDGFDDDRGPHVDSSRRLEWGRGRCHSIYRGDGQGGVQAAEALEGSR